MLIMTNQLHTFVDNRLITNNSYRQVVLYILFKLISLIIIKMDNRPIKGNSSGNYNMNFIDPTNDICAYYGGFTQLQELVEAYLQTITFHKINKAQLGKSKVYGQKSKQEHYMDHCSVCLGHFSEGQKVRILPCKHCFHKDCVTPWFQSNTHCPNCRFQLPIARQ